ncbi:MAG: cytoplasmic protein [Clostridiales bacterium]|nr:cytoplasmic protein [Clostridiales bacterium]
MDKIAFFAFNGNLMCFQHVLLNVLDMSEKGMDVKLIIEGEAVKLIKEHEESENKLYREIKEAGLISAVCKACSAKLGVLEFNTGTGLPIVGDMGGHPAMSVYTEMGYTIITL